MRRTILLSPLLLLFACAGESGPIGPGGTPLEEATYYRDVLPLVARECLSCHVDGGIAPFVLDNEADVRENIDSIVATVMDGSMPPWLPDDECREFENPRGLSADEREVFRRWRAFDTPSGDPADAPELPEPPPEFVPTAVARMTEAYVPNPAAPDDYRCFLLDYEFETDTFITGSNIRPGRGELVHHVLVYALQGDQIDTVRGADEAEDGPGYTCFGGPLAAGGGEDNTETTLAVTQLGGWVPGQLPAFQRDGSAVFVPAGARIVMQVHYNLLSGDPAEDQTDYEMILQEADPERLVTTNPLAVLNLDIPAGEVNAVHSEVFRNYRSTPIRVASLTPHMHLLGRRMTAEIVPAVGDDDAEACLINVPQWDFDWQSSYALSADDPAVIAPGAGVRVTCEHDNSVSNQPVINGEPTEPRDVTWGDGSLDEMCLLYLAEEQPMAGTTPTIGCEATTACLEECDGNEASCLLSCEGVGGACRPCLLRATLGCATSSCLLQFGAAQTCLESCINSYAILGGSYEACLRAECPDVADGVLDCTDTILDDGTCDDQLNACGVSWR